MPDYSLAIQLTLSFVRYRLFRVLDEEKTVGYVILNDSPERILVAQCDGEDAQTLAMASCSAFCKLATRILSHALYSLVCCHPEMQKIYKRFGFKKSGADCHSRWSLGIQRADRSDTSKWLVNLDWVTTPCWILDWRGVPVVIAA